MSGVSLVPGAVNFRDVGGLPAGAARTRSGVLYRSGNLARLEDGGVGVLEDLGLRRIIDLRDDLAVKYDASPAQFADRTHRVPLFLGSVESFFVQDMSLGQMYRAIVDESAERVVDVVRGVIADQPVLVHCTVGKDRTGVTVALTLAAAGVDLDAVVADYARTSDFLSESRNRSVVERIRQVHPASERIVELATLSPAPVMAELIADLTARFGSPTDYLRANGVADDEIVELRRVLIDTA